MDITIFALIIVYTTGLGLLGLMAFRAIEWIILERIIEPSFDFRNFKRNVDIICALFLLSVLFTYTGIDILVKHFAAPEGVPDAICRLIIPSIVFCWTRILTRIWSVRIAKQFLYSVVLLTFISMIFRVLFSLVSLMPTLDFGLKYILPVVSLEDVIAWSLNAILLWLIMDVPLFYIHKVPLVGSSLVRKKTLIDIGEKLPVKCETVIGEDNIKNVIKRLIDRTENVISIVTKGYTTVNGNLDLLKEKKAKGCRVQILGPPSPDAEKTKKLLGDSQIHVCICGFDDIRLIISDDKEALVSFATAGYQGSHIGVYSSHQFLVSLFRGYFDTKCNSCGYCRNNCVERRAFERVQKTLVVELVKDGSSMKTSCLNLSGGGMFISYERPWELNPSDRFQLKFNIPGDEVPTVVDGEVVWLTRHKEKSHKPNGFGVKFINMEPHNAQRIQGS